MLCWPPVHSCTHGLIPAIFLCIPRLFPGRFLGHFFVGSDLKMWRARHIHAVRRCHLRPPFIMPDYCIPQYAQAIVRTPLMSS